MSAAPPNKPDPPQIPAERLPEKEVPASGGRQPPEVSVPPVPRGADAPRSPVIPPAFRPTATSKPEIPARAAAVNEPDQERDLWWGSYSGWTMVPGFVLSILLTAGLAVLGWYLFRNWFPNQGDMLRYGVYALAWTIWLFQLVRWVYRLVGKSYRLTTRRLFYSEGFLYPPRDAVQLEQVSRVLVEQGVLERLLDVGKLRIIREQETSDPTPLVLLGIRTPQRIGDMIEKAVQRAKKKHPEPVA